ncbi:MAG: PRC-barrel domain-containing protein [Homoserinimonas sp.]
MISNENLGALMGAPVVGPDDERIGTVGQVFVDPNTGSPNWVTVLTGMFGRHETFVPLDEATWDREVLHIPFEKDLVKEAPRIDTEEALEPQAEDELYRYYGLEPAVDTTGGDRDGAEVAESLRLRKYRVTEEKDVSVPVTHEEVRLEPEPTQESDAAPTDDDDHRDDKVRGRKGKHRA